MVNFWTQVTVSKIFEKIKNRIFLPNFDIRPYFLVMSFYAHIVLLCAPNL